MNAKQFIKLVKENANVRLAILDKKGHDYSEDADTLRNFKRLASICKELEIDMSSADGVALFFIILKVQRLCNLLMNEKKPMNESVIDSINDAINYLDLLNGILIENTNK
jgi:hypothetical protein